MDNIWKPISKAQETFLALPDSITEAFFGGSAGPGKSECLMMYPVVRKWYLHDRFKALFLRRTYKELKLEIIPRTRKLYPSLGGKLHKTDLVWDFGSEGGGLIFFGHCETEGDITRYDSMEINLFLPDEVQSLEEFMYMYIGFTRVRTSIPELPAIIRGAGMPGGIGHTWVKKRFIDSAPEGSKILSSRSGNKRIFIKSTLVDNPKVTEQYAKGLEELPEAEKRAKKYGDWSSYEGQVFSEFRDKHYPNEPENAIHVIEPFSVPEWWPRLVAIDWGYTPPAMTYVSYGAISPDRRLVIYKEQAWQKKPIEYWASYVKERIEIENPKSIKICSSSKQNRGQEKTIFQQVQDAIGRSIDVNDSSHGSRIAGKMLLHEYLRWQPKYMPEKFKPVYDDEKARWILRNQGMVEYKAYMGLFVPEDEEKNLPKLLIFNTNKLLINAIKACTYDKTNPEDVAEFGGDDPYDAIRILLDDADNYFNQAASELKKLTEQQQIVDGLELSHDWNAYYRNMKRIESFAGGPAPVKRFHHVH